MIDVQGVGQPCSSKQDNLVVVNRIGVSNNCFMVMYGLVGNFKCHNISKFNNFDTGTDMLQHVRIMFCNIGDFSCCQSGYVNNIEIENDTKNNIIKVINSCLILG